VVTSRDGADWTTIDCENQGRGFWVHQWESSSARIEKLTIANGNANGGNGGGILCDIAGPVIAGCRIISCGGARYGGGMALWLYGGAVERCVIAGNHASDGGGGIATQFGGGVSIADCVIVGNSTEYGAGGGVAFADDDGDLMRGCTVTANYGGGGGGGIYTNRGSALERCIIWGNCASGPGRDVATLNAVTSLTCCDVDTSGVYSYFGTVEYDPHCVYTDPMFCGPVPCAQTTNGDWTLNAKSPCLADHSPCHELIGAMDEGCGTSLPTGGCCLPDGSCVVLDHGHCEQHLGTYMGDNSTCTPNPCQPVPTKVMTWGQIKSAFR